MSFALKVTTRTENRKLSDGKIGVAATYRPVGLTCPQECPLLERICYALKGNVAIHQKRARFSNDSLDIIAETDTKLVRHNVSGDLFLENKLDLEHIESVFQFHRDHPDIQGWLYTHRALELSFSGYGPEHHPKNLMLIASCETLEDAIALQASGWRTARVAAHEDRKPGEVICRYNLDKTPCSKCKLCWSTDPRIKGILFKKK